jgi:hypothetical protein
MYGIIRKLCPVLSHILDKLLYQARRKGDFSNCFSAGPKFCLVLKNNTELIDPYIPEN